MFRNDTIFVLVLCVDNLDQKRNLMNIVSLFDLYSYQRLWPWKAARQTDTSRQHLAAAVDRSKIATQCLVFSPK